MLNPHARFGRARRLQPEVEGAFRARGIAAEFRLTEFPGHGTELVAGMEAGCYDGVVAAGGDGTLFEVVNGLYALEPADRPPLGVLPLGTGNAFARDLELRSGDWQEALDIIAGGRLRKVDVGQVTTLVERFHFINIIGWGFVVDSGLAARRFKLAGDGAYTLGVLTAMASLKTQSLRIELDGQVIEQDNLLGEVSNSRYTGTHFLIAPDARLDDGLFDVTLVRRLSRRRLLRLFPTIYDGRHLEFEEVTARQARHVRVTEPAGLPLMPDGEFRGHTPLEIQCIPRDLKLFYPAG